MEKPNSGDPKEKATEGILYKFCNGCHQWKGSLTDGNNTHTTSEHKTPAAMKASMGDKKEVGMTGITIDDPIEVEFG